MSIINFIYVYCVVFTTLLGIVIGSFLNVVIYRIPEKRTIVKGHSMCMSCGHTLSVADLVPIFSWLFLRGKCRYCSAPIASRYMKIESFTGAVFLLLALCNRIYMPNLLYFSFISISNTFALFALLLSVAVTISLMMIYYDTKKCFYGFPLFLFCAYSLDMILRVLSGASARITLITSAIHLGYALLATGVVALISCIFRKGYSLHDLWFDLSFALLYFLFAPAHPIGYGFWAMIILFIAVNAILRTVFKGGKFDKYIGIISTVCFVLTFAISNFIFN